MLKNSCESSAKCVSDNLLFDKQRRTEVVLNIFKHYFSKFTNHLRNTLKSLVTLYK